MRENASEDKKLAPLLISSIASSDIKDLATDISEVGLDQLLDDGVLREIPIIKALVGARKTVVAIRDLILMKKIVVFLTELRNIPKEQREDWARRINEDEKYQRRVGESLVMILDRFEHTDKSKLLAQVFNGYVREEIDFGQFQRMASAIDRAYLDDLNAMLDFFTVTPEGDAKSQWAPWDKLYLSGLSRIEVHIDTDKQRQRIASGSPYPVTEQRVSFTHSQDALALAQIILGDNCRFTVKK